ncbi:hypothetical protein F5884DRAFT_758029 [Xylogone sp. PMI_703]|nr:hypothetical protein F5884DRAFT_758029 [Xylogone sp. PMI_703]
MGLLEILSTGDKAPAAQFPKPSRTSSALSALSSLSQPKMEKIFRFPGSVGDLTVVAKNLTEAYDAFQTGNTLRREIKANSDAFRQTVLPEVQTFATSINKYLKYKNFIDLFQTFLTGAGVVSTFLDVIQGSPAIEHIGLKIHGELEAKVGLAAPDKFAKHVDKYIRQEAANVYGGDVEHLYFLYHPDTDWHAEFHHIVQSSPVPANFLGMSENLHALCAWMLFLRKQVSRSNKIVRFHLLIPTYRPLVIKQAFLFPDELYPLTVHGHIHNSREYVWLNLPTMKDLSPDVFLLSNVGNVAALPNPAGLQSTFTWMKSWFVNPNAHPIVLGKGQNSDDVPEVPDAVDESPEKLKGTADITIQPGTRRISRREDGRHRKHRSSRREGEGRERDRDREGRERERAREERGRDKDRR